MPGNIPISALPTVTSIGPTDVLLLEQGGVTSQGTVAQLLASTTSSSVSSLATITDVHLTNLTNGQVLTYSTTASGWINSAILYSPDIAPTTPSAFDDEFNGTILGSKWTVFNATPASNLRTVTLDPNYGQVIFDSPYTTQDRSFLISQPAPIGPFTLTAKMGRINGANNYNGPMLFFSGATATRYLFGGLYHSGFGGPVTYSLILNADQTMYQDNKVPNFETDPSSKGYYRLVYRAMTSIDFHYSATGKFNGSTLVATAEVTPIGASIATIGIGMHPYGSFCSTYCDWFRVTTP